MANIDELIGKAIPSEGSVKGRLERLNVHNRFEFVIYPPIPGYSVKCVFKDELYEKIHEAIRKNVTVYGALHFRPEKPFPEWVDVTSIEIHRPDDPERSGVATICGTGPCDGDTPRSGHFAGGAEDSLVAGAAASFARLPTVC